MSEKLAKLVVSLEAQTTKYMKGMDAANRRAEKFQKRFSKSMGKAGTAVKVFAGAFAVSKIKSFYKSHADGIDDLAKTADALNVTTESLQALNHMAELNGISSTQMSVGMRKMETKLGEAARKGGTTADALKDLGVNLDDIINKKPDEQIEQLAHALGNLENQNIKASIATDLFGREGIRMIKVLNQIQRDGVEPTIQELSDLGASISRIDAAKVEIANDQFTRMNKVLGVAGTRIAVETAPIVGGLVEMFIQASTAVAGTANTTTSFSRRAVPVIAFVADMVHGLKIAWLGVRQVVAEFAGDLSNLAGMSAKGFDLILDKFGVDSQAMQNIQDFAGSMAQTTTTLRQELIDSLTDIPSNKVKAFLNNYLDKVEVEAATLAENSRVSLDGLLTGGEVDTDPASDPKVKKVLTVEQEITRLKAAELSKRNKDEAEAARRIELFQQASTKSKIKSVIAEGLALTQGAANTSRKLFKINKMLALADAAVTLPSAVLKAIERGGGLPWGAAFGALTLASGMARINSIRKATFGGGTSASLAGTTGGATPTVDVSAPSSLNSSIGDADSNAQNDRGPVMNFIVNGDVLGLDNVQEAVLDMVAHASSTGAIRVTDTSGRTLIERT